MSKVVSHARICLVQGASRGIGFSLTSELLARFRHSASSTEPTQNVVIATCRKPDDAEALIKLKRELSSSSNLTFDVVPLDVTVESTIKEAAQYVKEKYGRVDLLINSAGLLRPERTISAANEVDVLEQFKVNAVGPMLVAKWFAKDLLAVPPDKRGTGTLSALVNISARSGSISENELGGWYSYRASKAALNQITKTLALELKQKGVLCVALHPGTVDTDMSRTHIRGAKHLLTPQESASHMLNTLDNLQMSNTGAFLNYDSQPIAF